MLTTDLCSMKFYCFDYYLEHLKQPILIFRSDADKCCFNKYSMLKRERFLYAKYLEYSLRNPQNCKHKIISTFFLLRRKISQHESRNWSTFRRDVCTRHSPLLRNRCLKNIYYISRNFFSISFHAGMDFEARRKAHAEQNRIAFNDVERQPPGMFPFSSEFK